MDRPQSLPVAESAIVTLRGKTYFVRTLSIRPPPLWFLVTIVVSVSCLVLLVLVVYRGSRGVRTCLRGR